MPLHRSFSIIHANVKNAFYPIMAVLCLNILGVIILYSAEIPAQETWAQKQLLTMVLGFFIAMTIAEIDPKILYKYAYHIYIITVLLLLAALFFGHQAMGAQRWLKIGAFNIQPSEFAKIGVVLAIAKFYHNLHFFDSIKVKSVLFPIIITMLPFFLIIKQPSLSTAGVIFLTFICISFASGISLRLFTVGAVCSCLLLPVFWGLIHDYQKVRIISFLHPENDPFGAGYNTIQSLIAIGSGGLIGKGWGRGTQGQLEFLPEKHTDFILSLFAEEFGFIGFLTVFALIFVIILNLYIKSLWFHNHFSRLIVTGFCSIIFFHTLVNTLMICGLFPVAGIPFPFLSYGRSNLLMLYILFGMVLNCIRNHDARLKNL